MLFRYTASHRGSCLSNLSARQGSKRGGGYERWKGSIFPSSENAKLALNFETFRNPPAPPGASHKLLLMPLSVKASLILPTA